MKKILFILVTVLFLTSCQLDNVYQKMGLVKPQALDVSLSAGVKKVDGKSIDFVKELLGPGHVVSFNVTTPENFTGCILRSQSREELEKLTNMVNAKCYSKEELNTFLNTKVTDQNTINAVNGIAQVLDISKENITKLIKKFFPTVSGEDLTEEQKQYNSMIKALEEASTDIVDSLFTPVISMFNNEITNSDYIKCQLTVDFIDGVFASIDEVYKSLDLGKAELNKTASISGDIKDIADVAVGALISNLITPLACMDRIAFGNEKTIGLPSFDSILNALK
ncbi:lipoprotein [Bullifex sp.]|uniref:lipoprotein n=1 Tax=Bullifex sp. TaxID=2815808 RepID=UPI002A8305C4|nr:lipoprotein [Bullifex sp.]MDY4066909.1 lipoprotein [Bullifex sp.]